MALTESRRMENDLGSFETADELNLFPNGKRCFYCGQFLRDAADERSVVWSGSDMASTTIFLHTTCAVELGTHLIKDGMIGDRPEVTYNQIKGFIDVRELPYAQRRWTYALPVRPDDEPDDRAVIVSMED